VLKLYKITDNEKLYWETWDNDDGAHTVHWGELGTEGQTKTVKSSLFKSKRLTNDRLVQPILI